MCLGVPGRIERFTELMNGVRMGVVSFGGVHKTVCLACVPEAVTGDYVIVHVGFAIHRIDEAEAQQVFRALHRMDALGELDAPEA